MTRDEKIIRNKVGVLELAKQLGSVSQACRIMGFSRDSFYRFRDLYQKGGEAALIEMSRRVPNPKNRVAEAAERRIIELALEQPTWGHTRMANDLAKEDLRVSPTGVRGVWVRHDLNTMAKRLKAFRGQGGAGRLDPDRGPVGGVGESQGGQGGARRVRQRLSRLLWGAGHLLRRHVEGGRIYQQTFIDTYAKVAFAKLGACPRARRSRDPGDVKTAITAADLLNDRVLPFFDEHGIPLCRVLTDRGSEYCGNPERHEYELYLAIEDIDHSRTELQADLDQWLRQ